MMQVNRTFLSGVLLLAGFMLCSTAMVDKNPSKGQSEIFEGSASDRKEPIEIAKAKTQDEPRSLRIKNIQKRAFPNWYQGYAHHGTGSFSPRVSSESKRFLPFHPFPRFREISIGGGSTLGSYSRPSFNYPAFVSNAATNPLPSDPRPRPKVQFSDDLELGGPDSINLPEEVEEIAPAGSEAMGVAEALQGDYNAADLLEALASLSSDRGSRNHIKSFRFGMSK